MQVEYGMRLFLTFNAGETGKILETNQQPKMISVWLQMLIYPHMPPTPL